MKKWISIVAVALSLKSACAFGDENWNVHGQATLVPQAHGAFTSPYSLSPTSLSEFGELKTSFTATVFSGARLWKGADVYFNPELSAGSGLSNTHGIAGFPNAEIYRVGDSTALRAYLSRLYLRQIFGFGGPKEVLQAGPNSLEATVDVSRLTFSFGKFSLNDFFDNNLYTDDPRTQFLNWALMDTGSWDYAADTRGYTWGVYLEFNQRDWAVRFASVLEPYSANQLDLDMNLLQAHGDNLEFEYRYKIGERPGRLRAMAYMNHARMGNYRSAILLPSLDVKATRTYSLKYGFGLGWEQMLTPSLGAFGRLGWNDGTTETWAFTEIDQTFVLGLSLLGSAWRRPLDTVGLAYIANGLSQDHSDFLRAGGAGFMIGDGKLNYAPEQILEAYYSFSLAPMLFAADFQQVFNPGYNYDRGPVSILALRIHAEL